MLHDITFAIWFLLPAACANVAPVIAARVPHVRRWNTPVDGGRTFRGKELFGTHKTWRGLIAGMVISTLIFGLQQSLASEYGWADTLSGTTNYTALPVWLLGPLFGLGALGGDMIESFFKRQRDIPSGQTWIPFDQIDYIIGAVAVSLPFVLLSPAQYVWIFVVWFVIHLLATYCGWRLGLKVSPV